MTIGKKLFSSFGAAFAVTLIVGIVSFSSISKLDGTINKIAKVTARKQFLAGEINTAMSDILSLERAILCRSYMKDKAKAEGYDRDFQEKASYAKKQLDEFTALVETAEGRRMLTDMQSGVDKAGEHHNELLRLVRADMPEAAAQHVTAKVLPVVLQTRTAGGRLVTLQQELTQAAAAAAGSTVVWARWVTVLMILLSLAVAAIVVYIVRQINGTLRQTVAELNEGAAQTASAAGQVSTASQSLAQGSSEQAASLEETSASTEEISSMAHKNTDNSKVAAELVTQSQQKFTETNHSLDGMVAAMGEINDSSDKIAKIIKTIDEIAFQTNILALNAAVEAARAGEAGMGFAVVADEVRSLAQRCAQAARDTAELIEDSISKSNGGKTKVDEVAVAFREITSMSARVKTLVDEVNLGSEEQTRGIEQIGKAISQMEQVTQRTAAGAEESASAAEELTAQSETLRDIVCRLSQMVDGSDGQAKQQVSHVATQQHAAPRPALQYHAAAAKTVRHAPPAKTAKHEIPLDGDFHDF